MEPVSYTHLDVYKRQEFKVYDLDNKKYVEQVTTYPVTTTHKSYFTDSQGYLIMPKNLKIGHYRIEGMLRSRTPFSGVKV